jgi:pimeloyl-ACP methyl ester carboxylesterase
MARWAPDPSAMRVPTLLWHGELDRDVPVVAGRHLASAIPNCRATFYPHEAHLSLLFNHQKEILRALGTA